MSILGDVSKIYQQYTLIRQDDFPLSALVCFDALVIAILILSHYAFICSVYLPLLHVEVAGVSEAYEDAANCLWLLSNSKPCANCKSPIQKNEGCNHMQCAKVGSQASHIFLTQTVIRLSVYLVVLERYVNQSFSVGENKPKKFK